MKLYDESIKAILEILKKFTARKLNIKEKESNWPDIGQNNIVLRSDTAYELGGPEYIAISGTAITESKELVPCDEVLLYGPDIPEINTDIPYARIAFIRVREDSMGTGNTLYNAIHKIEYVRYHMNPKGYMTRISVSKAREPVRISKEAQKEGLDFAKVGKLFVKSYHENPKIEAVKLIFITLDGFPYNELESLIKNNNQITDAIDHIMKNIVMDCNVCNLKPICDEVEGMKELHFTQADTTMKS